MITMRMAEMKMEMVMVIFMMMLEEMMLLMIPG